MNRDSNKPPDLAVKSEDKILTAPAHACTTIRPTGQVRSLGTTERAMEATSWGRVTAFLNERRERQMVATRRASRVIQEEPDGARGELVMLPTAAAIAAQEPQTTEELAQALLANFFAVDHESRMEIVAFSGLARQDYRDRFRR